jgi:nucleotide-binding universal stress UspA family protein
MLPSQVPEQHSAPAKFILHPTDFSAESELAFAHALRLALTSEADLSLLHMGKNQSEDWERFPSVRKTLEKWGVLEPGSTRADVNKLKISVEKVISEGRNVVHAVCGFATRRPVDLLVLASEGRDGLSAWLAPPRSEQVAFKSRIPTLFVPSGGKGCVSLETGEVTLNEILIPVDHDPPAEAAVERGLRAMEAFGTSQSRLTLLYVGPQSEFPHVRIPDGAWTVIRAVRQGDPATEILAAAKECGANAIMMVTDGADGFLESLRGSTTSLVLRHASCPLLAVPADF